MANNSSLSKRAALRQQQEQHERGQRNKRILFAGFGLALVVGIVIVGIVVFQSVTAGRGVTQAQLTPPNSTSEHGILFDGKQPSADKPHLVIWEDFQCPACKAREAAYGSITEQLVADAWAACDQAQGGWVNYLITNPVSRETQAKTSYVVPLDEDHLLGCGCYLNSQWRHA